jgi:hypothetical protein
MMSTGAVEFTERCMEDERQGYWKCSEVAQQAYGCRTPVAQGKSRRLSRPLRALRPCRGGIGPDLVRHPRRSAYRGGFPGPRQPPEPLRDAFGWALRLSGSRSLSNVDIGKKMGSFKPMASPFRSSCPWKTCGHMCSRTRLPPDFSATPPASPNPAHPASGSHRTREKPPDAMAPGAMKHPMSVPPFPKTSSFPNP